MGGGRQEGEAANGETEKGGRTKRTGSRSSEEGWLREKEGRRASLTGRF
jgi:hypothetical protein